jgi:hypothetical protein
MGQFMTIHRTGPSPKTDTPDQKARYEAKNVGICKGYHGSRIQMVREAIQATRISKMAGTSTH